MSNKGKRLITCPRCNTKRYHIDTNSASGRTVWLCSKGHKWAETRITAYDIGKLVKETFKNVSSLFDRADTFYSELNRSRRIK